MSSHSAANGEVSMKARTAIVFLWVLATGFGPLDETSGDDEMKLAGAVLRYSIERDD